MAAFLHRHVSGLTNDHEDKKHTSVAQLTATKMTGHNSAAPADANDARRTRSGPHRNTTVGTDDVRRMNDRERAYDTLRRSRMAIE